MFSDLLGGFRCRGAVVASGAVPVRPVALSAWWYIVMCSGLAVPLWAFLPAVLPCEGAETVRPLSVARDYLGGLISSAVAVRLSVGRVPVVI